MAETRARKKIRQAVEAKGYRLTKLTWEPWGQPTEKEGIPGGWVGYVTPKPRPDTDFGDVPNIMGLSVAEALEWIKNFLPQRVKEEQ